MLSGLIPALAGKTCDRRHCRPGREAHPRAGGENDLCTINSTPRSGSSPRWRGKQGRDRARSEYLGLIPALAGKTTRAPRGAPSKHGSSPRWRGKRATLPDAPDGGRLIPALAGKTCEAKSRLPSAPAHPRAGGENLGRVHEIYGQGGSSPRWRGKHLRRHPLVSRRGLIPALAGKTLTAANTLPDARAHPRAGGENERIFPSRNSSSGSSPRWRGKHPPR